MCWRFCVVMMRGSPAFSPPGLADIDRSWSNAGRQVWRSRIGSAGTLTPVSPSLDLSVYRIVQEALTNVTKHAGTAQATVDITFEDEAVIISVTDKGALHRNGHVLAPDTAMGPRRTMASSACASGPRCSADRSRPDRVLRVDSRSWPVFRSAPRRHDHWRRRGRRPGPRAGRIPGVGGLGSRVQRARRGFQRRRGSGPRRRARTRMWCLWMCGCRRWMGSKRHAGFLAPGMGMFPAS